MLKICQHQRYFATDLDDIKHKILRIFFIYFTITLAKIGAQKIVLLIDVKNLVPTTSMSHVMEIKEWVMPWPEF